VSAVELPQVQTSRGLGVLHLFGKVTEQFNPAAMAGVVLRAQREADTLPRPGLHDSVVESAPYAIPAPQIITVEILGHKADLGFMILDYDFWRLRSIQTALGKAGIHWESSYISLTEISEYAAGVPDEMRWNRLYPRLAPHPKLAPEDKPAWCFYPMSKRRWEQHNWFRLPYEERKSLMYEHGASGRKFSGRVLQVVTGSTGLDDFEWGVTLFCQEPQDLKDVVYNLRFDEGSALYGEFGAFWTGMVADPEAIAARFAR